MVEEARAESAVVAEPLHVLDLIQPAWPPLRHVRRGWDALTVPERRRVAARITTVLDRHKWGPGSRDAMARFFTFLAQVETIAIEIPLRALPSAPAHLKPLLRRQLCDEVFHSAIFARLAHELSLPASQPPEPVASAERLLDRIRNEPDMAVSATMLNLVAEAWIETLFKHALKWGIADVVFTAVLEDESRHVEEAMDHLGTLDRAAALPAVRALEEGLIEVGSEPTVALAMLDLAGETNYRVMAEELQVNHRRQLAKVGLEPSPTFAEMDKVYGSPAPQVAQPREIPDTPWRAAARQVWDTPRDPTMQGDFDVAVGHIPKRLLTPVLVSAIARAWAQNPRLNRIVSRGKVWQLPQVNVGVRVLVADDELATVVIPNADQCSVKDIMRMVTDGYQQLLALRERRMRNEKEGRIVRIPDAGVAELVPPNATSFSVALSNPGKFGLVSGAGSFSGAMSPSSDLTVGQRRRMPKWYGVAYLPAWHINMGCLQDHRVFDGREAGVAMTALRQQLSRKGVREILAVPDTLDEPAEAPLYDDAWFNALPPELRMVSSIGFVGKSAPYVIGGAALAGALGIGGYMLYQSLNATGAAGAGGAAGAAGAAGGAAGGTAAGAANQHAGAVTGTDADGDGEGAEPVEPDEPAEKPKKKAKAKPKPRVKG